MPGDGYWKHGGYRGLGFLYKRYIGRYRPAWICHPGYVDCPEQGGKVHFRECVQCEKFQVWDEKDQALKRCWHEFKDLKSRGFYDGTWDDHPENFDPDTFARIQERKRINEEANREFELERAELARRAEELKEKFPPSYFCEYYDLHPDGSFDEEEEEISDDEEDS